MAKKRKKKVWNKEDESHLELLFLKHWTTAYPYHSPVRELHFHPTRKFRFDFAWPSKKTALEIQGYGPGHFSLPGMTQDCDKHIHALTLNWRVIYITSLHLSPDRIQTTLLSISLLLAIPPKSPRSPQSGYIPFKHRRTP